MLQKELEQINRFFMLRDESGVSNLEKTQNAEVIRRVDTTDQDKSYESVGKTFAGDNPVGVVIEDGKLIGFGIHIFNEDVYPLQSFEIYLRNLGLIGYLDLSGCQDMVFVDLYHNRISSIVVSDMPSLRILGLQDNKISQIDVSSLTACQGIDIGMNELARIDVSMNKELAELYINHNRITQIDLTNNEKLKYLYCHNNKITSLDTTHNPLLRHLDATKNPMKSIKAFAPGSDGERPLELYAKEGGCIGLKFNPVYDAQWKETGEWQQSYYAYPDEGWLFDGWMEGEECVSDKAEWLDEYGSSRVMHAAFKRSEEEKKTMTYEDIVWEAREVFEDADAREIYEHIAVQVNVSGEGEGIFYIEVANREICVEPYDYHDRDGLAMVEGRTIADIASGKLDLRTAFDKGLIRIEGNKEKLELLRKIKIRRR